MTGGLDGYKKNKGLASSIYFPVGKLVVAPIVDFAGTAGADFAPVSSEIVSVVALMLLSRGILRLASGLIAEK